ncbi:hypothetical protein A0J61_04567 [Choanephora cucurbitarum]|uniref:Uncharacterized protein n=1 Tax=Choanephora cucurbitarum TaxID=101091 RepID=A0A1C7NE66_9FUNG|nr:hypothetical protein A0J61_04567 [Choanephora cucurbitarum]
MMLKSKKHVPKDDIPIQETSALAEKWSHLLTFSPPNPENLYILETFKRSKILRHELATDLSESDANKCEYKEALQDIVGDTPQPMEEHGITVEGDIVEAEQKDVEKDVEKEVLDTDEDKLRGIIGTSLEPQTLEKHKRGRPKNKQSLYQFCQRRKTVFVVYLKL